MRRLLWILLAINLLTIGASLVSAQTTTVTGTVVDGNNNAYFPGTVSAVMVLNSGQAPPTGSTFQLSTSTTSGGNFSLTLTSNQSYVFTICGAPSLLNVPTTNPTPKQVCFTTVGIVVSGGAQNVTSSLGTVPILGPGSPLSVSNINAATSRIIWPTDPAYGAKWDVKAVTDASFTNTSNVATCPNSDCNFTSSDLGKIVYGTTYPWAMTTGCNAAACGSVLIAQGFICGINNANSINVGLTFPTCAADNATAGCTSGSGTLCALVWGTQDDTTAIQAAAAIAWGDGVHCYALGFPSGMAFFHIPPGGLLNVAVPSGSPCNGTLIGDSNQIGAQVFGSGPGTTSLVPLPTETWANATGGNSGTAAISGPRNWFAHDFGIHGFGVADNGTTHNNNLIEFAGNPGGGTCTATAAWNMAFDNWEAASIGTQGFVIDYGCGVLNANNIVSEAFGNTNCTALDSQPGNTTVNFTGVDCFGSSGAAAGASLAIQAQNFTSTGGFYWGNNVGVINSAAVKMLNGTGSTFNSFGDHIIASPNGNNSLGIWFSSGGTQTLNLSGTTINTSNSSGTGNNIIFLCSASITCNINSYASTVTPTGTKAQLSNSGGTTNFKDACANNITQGSTVASSGTNNYFGSCSVTGTAITAPKLVLSAGWGTTAAWTALTGATQYVTGTITASGTGQTANPTIVYTFPTPFLATPFGCSATQVGGTQTAVANPFTPSALSATGVTFTYNGTPVAGSTLFVQISCGNP